MNWIDIKEKKPRESEFVNVYEKLCEDEINFLLDNNMKDDQMYKGVCSAFYFGGKFFIVDPMEGGFNQIDVSKWQPLPEPPKE